MNVRRAEPSDAGRVLALMEGLTRPAVADDPAPQRDVFLAHLDREDAAIFVAEADGELVGAVSLWIQPRLNWTTPQGWIPDLYVDPAFRRRGAARALLDACAELCRERGCHVLVLESGHHRAEAHRLYESYGFEHYARAYSLRL
ncbi:MAG TPA: GNAT family N-acetyltransferase [Gaiellaceae bacterium]|nr:GNAT family N-acetyltransferase [Gaiellaceae bacterium]